MTHKYCCDCKYFKAPAAANDQDGLDEAMWKYHAIQKGACGRSEAEIKSYISPVYIHTERASTMRENVEKCGPDAQWFEPKE